MKKARLVWVSGGYSAKSPGATRTVDMNMVAALKKQGVEVVWLARGIGNQNDCYDLDSQIHYNFSTKIVYQAGLFFTRVFKKINLLHLHQLLLFILYDIFSLFVIKKYRLLKGTSFLVVRNGMSVKTVEYAKDQGVCSIIHNLFCHPITQYKILKQEFESEKVKRPPFSKRRASLQIKDYSTANILWSISTQVTSSLVQNNINPDRILYLPLGVDYHRYAPVDVERIFEKRKEVFQILFVGNVNLEKGVHILLKAIHLTEMVNIKVVFNGRIPKYFQSIFDALVTPLMDNGVEIIIAPGDPTENYHDSSVFVLPSVHESFGLVVLEAMAAGLPIIVSDNVGAKDCVLENENGLIFPSGDVQALASGLLFFYNDYNNVVSFGKKSLEHVLNYGWGKVARQLMEKAEEYAKG